MRRANAWWALVVLLALGGEARSAFIPWDALTADKWMSPAPPRTIVMYAANGGAYEVGFNVALTKKAAKGMNALQFVYGGASVGHLASTDQSGSFTVANSGDSRTFRDVLVLVTIQADALGQGFSMSLGTPGHLYAANPTADFAYHDGSLYATGRPSGYYSVTAPTREEIAYDFSRGMVTVIALKDVNLAAGGTLQVQYDFGSLPGRAVFSVYGFDEARGWVYHTNRALADGNDGTLPISTFEVLTPEPATLLLLLTGGWVAAGRRRSRAC